MDKKWQDLVPFYVANTLDEQERVDFERYMATDPECQAAVSEWQMIAAATWAEADAHNMQLPPLSQRVKAHAQGRTASLNGHQAEPTVPIPAVYRRPAHAKRQRRASAPLTMAASLAAMVLFGGLFVFLAFVSTENGSNFASQGATPTVDGTSMEVAAANTISPTPTKLGDNGILPTSTSVSPLATPVGILPFEATVTIVPPSAEMLPVTEPPLGTVAPMAVCTVQNPLTSAIGIYVAPGYQYTTAAELAAGEAMRSTVQSETGWYQVFSPEGGIIGWVDGAMVDTVGDCTALPMPTPTSAGNDLRYLGTVNVESTPLLVGPGTDYSVHHTLFLGEGVSVIARTPDSQWYLVLPKGDGGQGWVVAEDIVLNDNYLIPLVATIPPAPMVTITTTPPPPIVPTSGDTSSIQTGAWQHDVTVVQHDCGGEVGTVTTVDLTLESTTDNGGINIVYTATQTAVHLQRIGDGIYSGSYQTSADVAVTLTFTTPTTYTANETIVHESGCIVRMEWAGRYVGN